MALRSALTLTLGLSRCANSLLLLLLAPRARTMLPLARC
jgi:hypothetical protein